MQLCALYCSIFSQEQIKTKCVPTVKAFKTENICIINFSYQICLPLYASKVFCCISQAQAYQGLSPADPKKYDPSHKKVFLP